MERKHGKKKRYVKLHFAVNVETKEIVAMKVSTDDMHDVKAFPGLVKEAEERRRIACWLGDGAYDSGMVFEELEARGIVAMARGWASLAEEAPAAYKDVADVTRVAENAGLSRNVARLRPLGVIKG